MGDNFVMEEIAVYFKRGKYWYMITWRLTRGFQCNIQTTNFDYEFYMGPPIAVRGFVDSGIFHNLILRYGVEHWPGQTLPIPNDSSTEDECNAFCNELLQCMHQYTVNMILTNRDPPEYDPLFETERLHRRVDRASRGVTPSRRA